MRNVLPVTGPLADAVPTPGPPAAGAHAHAGRRALTAVLAFAAVVRLASLGLYALTDTTEARYAEIAREMAATGDWVTPRIDGGRPFWAKPPLSTWAEAASFRVLGVHEFAARFPSYVMCALSAALLYAVARRLYGAGVALTSVVVFATGALLFGIAGASMTDPALGLATTMAFAGFVLAVADPGTRRGRAWGLVFFAGLGAGLLAKGPVAVVLALAPIAVWAVWRRRTRDVLRALPWFSGSLLALAIAVPWYWAAEQRTPGFLRYFLEGEHWKRFTDPNWTGDLYGAPRTKPRGAIWAFAVVATVPWSLLLLPAAAGWFRDARASWRRFTDDAWAPFLAAWALAPVVLFTPSGSAMLYYVLPGLPAFALLAARTLTRGDPAGLPVARRTFLAAAALVPAAAAVVAGVPSLLPRYAREAASQLPIVEAWKRDSGGTGALAFATEDIECSADFYSGGRALRMVHVTHGAGDVPDAPASPEEWAAAERDHAPLYVVTRRERAAGVPPEVRARMQRVAAFERFALWRLRPEP